MAAPDPFEERQMSSTETRPADADADVGRDDGYAHYARKTRSPAPPCWEG